VGFFETHNQACIASTGRVACYVLLFTHFLKRAQCSDSHA